MLITLSQTSVCKAMALPRMGAVAVLWRNVAALRPPVSGVCAVRLALHRGQCSRLCRESLVFPWKRGMVCIPQGG